MIYILWWALPIILCVHELQVFGRQCPPYGKWHWLIASYFSTIPPYGYYCPLNFMVGIAHNFLCG
ncbi:MAG: hypothetical protein AB4426_21525 [Xenococcaceae cyanobacterium]